MSVTSVAARLPLSSFPCYNNPPIIHASGKTRAPDSRPSAAGGGFAFACAFRFGFASVCLLCCSVLSGRDYAANYTKVGNLSANCPAGRGEAPHKPRRTAGDGGKRIFFTRADLGKKENPAEKPRRPRNAHFVFLGRVAWPRRCHSAGARGNGAVLPGGRPSSRPFSARAPGIYAAAVLWHVLLLGAGGCAVRCVGVLVWQLGKRVGP